jgi:hypothetical protein
MMLSGMESPLVRWLAIIGQLEAFGDTILRA